MMFNSRFKTSFCRHWEQCGYCPMGDRCQYAHRQDEIRKSNEPLPPDAPVIADFKLATLYPNFTVQHYKTQTCKFWDKGYCRYGTQCSFAHGLEELRVVEDKELNGQGQKQPEKRELGWHLEPKLKAILTDPIIRKEINIKQLKFIISELRTKYPEDKSVIFRVNRAEELTKQKLVEDACDILQKMCRIF